MENWVPESLSITELSLRIALAALFGLILGLERDMKNKPVDFRAYMIVGIAACLISIITLEIPLAFADSAGEFIYDPMRVIAGVLVGIGFLGAGVILQKPSDNIVIGTATAASIWACAAVGIAIGFGFYTAAFAAFFALLITLVVFGWLQRILLSRNDKLPR